MATSTTIGTLAGSGYSFEILFTKLEHDYNKDLIILSIPQSEDPTNKSPITSIANPLNFLIDLQRLKQVITLTGFLIEEISSSALYKKDQLEAMLSKTGNLTISWIIGSKTISKTGNIMKCKVTELPQRTGSSFMTGKATSTSANKLVDSSAIFSTGGVTTNSVVLNMTDKTWADVSAVDSDTQLSLSADIFASGESYQIGLGTKTMQIQLQFAVGKFRG